MIGISMQESKNLERLQIALILIGCVLLFVLIQHSLFNDGLDRFRFLSSYLNTGKPFPRFSMVGPIISSPLWYLGHIWQTHAWWCAKFNTIVFCFGLLAFYRIFCGHIEGRILKSFLLLMIAGSMFPNHLMGYFGEVFTAIFVATGTLAALFRKTFVGWFVVLVGVLNTPASLVGCGLIGVGQSIQTNRWRYFFLFPIAILLFLIENWIARGHPLNTGYSNTYGPKTLMPYSGLPDMSYPFFFGLLSILFSFGKGLIFFAPGLLLYFTLKNLPIDYKLRQCLQLWIAFLFGLILVYSKWWSWYGGATWGPRFFLFASIPASMLLSLNLCYLPKSFSSKLVVLGALSLSVWVAINGMAFNQKSLQICYEQNCALEHLCWYVPEFSVLWRPFVVYHSMTWNAFIFSTYCFVVYLVLAYPLYRSIFIEFRGVVREWRQSYKNNPMVF